MDFFSSKFQSYYTTSEIIEGELYLGGRPSTTDLSGLTSRKISHIVSITNHDVELPSSEFKHMHIRLEDTESSNLLDHFDSIFDFIRSAVCQNTAALVHCEVGMSRSATTVIAYLMKHHTMSFKDAFTHTKQRRSIISPNWGFMAQLREFEIKCRPDSIDDKKHFLIDFVRSDCRLDQDISDEMIHEKLNEFNYDIARTAVALNHYVLLKKQNI